MFSAGAGSIPVAPGLPAVSDKKEWNAPITVQYPTEKMPLASTAKQIYLFGKINLPQPSLQINGQEVPVNHNGTFIAFLPVQTGPFEFILTATSQGKTYQAVRHVTVAGMPLEKLTDKARFDEERVYPRKPVWVMPADKILLSVRGTPGAQVTAELPGFQKNHKIVLTESNSTPGLYQQEYTFSKQAKPATSKVLYQLYDPHTKTKAKVTAKQRIRVLDNSAPLPTAQVTDPGVKLRQLPVQQGSLYPFYRAYGQVLIDGRDNGLYRLRLNHQQNAWLEENKLKITDASDYRSNTLTKLRTVSDEKATYITWSGQQQVPLSIREFSDRLEVVFYNTPSFEENFDFDATSPLLDHIAWEDPQDGTIKFMLFFKPEQMLWGHAYQYQENNLFITLRHPPLLSPRKNKPLLGARILIDAGHSPKRTPPYDGLVSPSGFLEYEANLALAMALKPKLQAAGATVIMTREKNNQMTLPQRYQKALQEDAHLFISLHHNALPDTVNPLAKPLGFSVYYTYPHSFQLAQSLHRAFNRHIDLPDSGLIANDILFIPRIPNIPSVLIENAYMILPEQEQLVMSKQGREQFAQAIYQGVLDFYATLLPAPVKNEK